MKRYVFEGNEFIGKLLEERLPSSEWTLTDDVEGADVAVTYCISQTKLEDAYFDTDGFVQRMKPGAILVDFSATTPSLAREISAMAEVSDLLPVEAPIVVKDTTVKDAFADRANVSAFVAGAKDAVDEARPVIEALAGAFEYRGESGSAQLARAAYTIQQTAQLLAAVEVDSLVRETCRSVTSVAHLDDHIDALTPTVEKTLKAVADERFSGTYTIEMFMAEVSAALTAADDIDLILPQLESSLHLLEILAVIGGVDMAPAALSLLYRDEEAAANHGLDWARAEEYYRNGGNASMGAHEHAHDGGDDAGDGAGSAGSDDVIGYDGADQGYGPDDFGDDYDDDDGYLGGFGGYSSN